MLLCGNGPPVHQPPLHQERKASQARASLVISFKASQSYCLMPHDLEKPPGLGSPSLQPTYYSHRLLPGVYNLERDKLTALVICAPFQEILSDFQGR